MYKLIVIDTTFCDCTICVVVEFKQCMIVVTCSMRYRRQLPRLHQMRWDATRYCTTLPPPAHVSTRVPQIHEHVLTLSMQSFRNISKQIWDCIYVYTSSVCWTAHEFKCTSMISLAKIWTSCCQQYRKSVRLACREDLCTWMDGWTSTRHTTCKRSLIF